MEKSALGCFWRRERKVKVGVGKRGDLGLGLRRLAGGAMRGLGALIVAMAKSEQKSQLEWIKGHTIETLNKEKDQRP